MNILVAGGAGYIGSHTSVELLKSGHDIIVVDNFSNSSPDVIPIIEKLSGKSVKLYDVDICDIDALEVVFKNHTIDGIIHFAGYKAVGESMEKPTMYYENNILTTIQLIKMCKKYAVNQFIYSSSATVYGDAPSPYKETYPVMEAVNAYGQSKLMCERILKDAASEIADFKLTLLRYFNPIGAHESGLIGDDPNGIPNNLAPYIQKVLMGKLECLQVFGDDYDTKDGTGVRDYIHVVDLAEAHKVAIENIKEKVNIYNVGTGRGTSVLEVIAGFEKASGRKVNYKVISRRDGDLASYYADASKIEREIGWRSKLDIDDMCRDCWTFVKHKMEL